MERLSALDSVLCYYMEYLSASGLKFFITSSLYVTYNKQTDCVYTEIKKPKRLISSLQGRERKAKFNTTVIATKINREQIFEFSLAVSKCNLGV